MLDRMVFAAIGGSIATLLLQRLFGSKNKSSQTNIHQETKHNVSKAPKYKGEKLKLVLCVRHDLGMAKGKMCAQSSHGAVGIAYQLLQTESGRDLFDQWTRNDQPKIVVKVDSEDQLITLQTDAESLGLDTYLVVDAGRTQVAPNSKTVLAIGPGPARLLDQVTGQLKLL